MKTGCQTHNLLLYNLAILLASFPFSSALLSVTCWHRGKKKKKNLNQLQLCAPQNHMHDYQHSAPSLHFNSIRPKLSQGCRGPAEGSPGGDL